MKRGQSISEILRGIDDATVNQDKVEEDDMRFLYEFVWDGSIGDEYDELKKSFVKVFGKEAALRLCAFTLKRHKFSLTADGFTEEEMSELSLRLFVTMVMLLNHQDLNTDYPLELTLTQDRRDLRAQRLAKRY